MHRIAFPLLLAALLWSCSDSSTAPPGDTGEIIPPYGPIGDIALPERLSDVWGYVDSTTGVEYALVGTLSNTGIYIVDVSDPAAPVLVSEVDGIPGFDLKAWQHYVYTVNGGRNGDGSIVDISNPAAPRVVGSFPTAHNIFISDGGFLVAEYPGITIYDLNGDPTAPVEVWRGGVEGHDASVIGDRLYDFHGGSTGMGYTRIYDISDPAAPVVLGDITDPTISYHHSGWTSADGRHLFICDELARDPQPDITVWDIADPANPVRVGEIRDSTATVHNVYVIDTYAYVAYYTAGFRIYDVSDPANPIRVEEYDASPSKGEGFSGTFGVYPFTPSGHIYVSNGQGAPFDAANKLLIFRFDGR